MTYTVETLHVGDGVTTQFGLDFVYQDPTHIRVSVDGVDVGYTTVSPAVVQVLPAPAAGSTVRVYRETPIANLNHSFQLGAPFLPAYVDANNLQSLYGVQESRNLSDKAVAAADSALEAAGAANSTAVNAVAIANAATSTANNANATAQAATIAANGASTAADAAVATANSAVAAANSAGATANIARLAASAATSTADAASATAASAASTADSAATAAATAVSTANAATATANAAASTADTALGVANAAAADAAIAVQTADSAAAVAGGVDAKAQTALDTAEQAELKANEAIQAVSAAGVASFNGRSGIVLAMEGDYSADMVSRGASTVDADLAAVEASTAALQTSKANVNHTHPMSDVVGLDTFVGAVDSALYDLGQRAGATEAALSSTVVRQTASTGAAQLPVGTSAQRPTPAAGHIRYNSATRGAELYTGALWNTLWDNRALKAPTGVLDMSSISFLKPGSFGIGEAVPLVQAVNLDTVVYSGFYRLGSGYSTELSLGQMIVSRGSDTILQIVGGQAGDLYFRAGSPPAVGGGGTYSGWANLTPTKTPNDRAPTRLIKNGDRQAVHAWVNFAGVGGIVTRGKYGINTVIRNGVGTYTIYYSTVFINDWYSCQVSCSRGAGIDTLVSATIIQQYSDSVLIEVTRESNGYRTNVDAEVVQVLIHGEYNNA